MKKILLSALAVGITIFSLQAQEKENRHHSPMQGRHHPQMMMQKLNLSDNQKQELKKINEDFRQKMSDLRKNEDITVREFKSRMQAIQKEHRSELQGLLTPEQKAQIDKQRKDRKAMAEANAKARMEKMKIRLGLTNDQVDILKDQNTAMMEKMKNIRTDESLSGDQKREEIKKLMKQRKKDMKSILTEDQLKQMKEMQRQRFKRPEPENNAK